MSATTEKKRVLKAVRDLPDDATIEDAMERLYLLRKIERGLKEVEEGKAIPQAQARQQFKTWHE